MIKDEALKMAIEHGFKRVIEPPCDYYKATEEQIEAFVEANKIVREQSKKLDAVFDRFKPKQPTQEPLGYVDEFGNFEFTMQMWMEEEPNVTWTPLYTHPKEALEQPTVAELNDEYLRDTYVEGLNQPTQEPVAWFITDEYGNNNVAVIDSEKADHFINRGDCIMEELYTHPKQWQGLSDEEIEGLHEHSVALGEDFEFARAIEAKLREKNG